LEKKQFYLSKAVAILMKSPQEGGCHACGGLTSQTLLYSLSCLGLIPTAFARWGELAGTETAGYLKDHYQLSYLEGRAEQFLLCCVAASGGLSEAQTENRICKWTHYKKQKQKDLDSGDPGNHHKAAFRDAIFPNQNLYHPVDGKLCIILRSGKRIVNPPADNEIHLLTSGIIQESTNDQHRLSFGINIQELPINGFWGETVFRKQNPRR
jgi:hypothetical protein